MEALIDPVTRGDPMSPLRWTSKSTRTLARALTKDGHRVSDFVVRRLLRELGYSLQANAKTTEGGQHPDRDAQFGYLEEPDCFRTVNLLGFMLPGVCGTSSARLRSV